MKKHAEPTRKRTALRRVLLAVIVLLLANHFLTAGLLLPIQAVQLVGQRQGIGWSRTVKRMWVPELGVTHLVYLTQTEEAVMLSDVGLYPFGWTPYFGLAVDCTQAGAVHAGYRSMHKDEEGVRYYFGRIDDPAITRVDISIREKIDPQGEEVQREVYCLSAEQEQFYTQQDRTFFLIPEVPERPWEGLGTFCPVLVAYDEAGNVIVEQELTEYSSSSYG